MNIPRITDKSTTKCKNIFIFLKFIYFYFSNNNNLSVEINVFLLKYIIFSFIKTLYLFNNYNIYNNYNNYNINKKKHKIDSLIWLKYQKKLMEVFLIL